MDHIGKLYEIPRYQHDSSQYILATTDNHTEEPVRQDVEHFNTLLVNETKSRGIRYIVAIGLA